MRHIGTTVTTGLAMGLLLAAAGATLPAPLTPRDEVASSTQLQTAKPKQGLNPNTKLVVENAAGMPGETRTLRAVLTMVSGGSPLAGKSVAFSIKGKDGSSVPGGVLHAGSAVTDGNGRAQVSFELPELAQENYAVKATYGGDRRTMTIGSSGEGNLLMVKAITKVELSTLFWGPYKNEPGGPHASFIAKVQRAQHDYEVLDRPLTVTVNGSTWTAPSQGIHAIPLPNGGSGPSPWQVHVQFEGDAAHAPSAAQATYVQPN